MSLELKSEGVMDGESGESRVENEVAGVGRDESELEWLVRGCKSSLSFIQHSRVLLAGELLVVVLLELPVVHHLLRHLILAHDVSLSLQLLKLTRSLQQPRDRQLLVLF